MHLTRNLYLCSITSGAGRGRPGRARAGQGEEGGGGRGRQGRIYTYTLYFKFDLNNEFVLIFYTNNSDFTFHASIYSNQSGSAVI